MVSTLVLALAGLTCILIETNAKVDWNLLHPIFGVITLALAFLNVSMYTQILCYSGCSLVDI